MLRRIPDSLLLFTIVLASFLLTQWPVVLTDTDAGRFAIALDNYSVANDHPYAPGAFWFVLLAKLVRTIMGNAQRSLLVSNVLLTTLGVVLFHRIARRFLPRPDALAAAALLALIPTVRFFAVRTDNYAATTAVACGMVLMVLDADTRRLAAAWFLIGFCGGIRPLEATLLAPLVFFATWRAFKHGELRPMHLAFLPVAALIGGTLWIGPSIVIEGGWAAYWHAATHQSAVEHHPSFVVNLARFAILGSWALVPIGVLAAWSFVGGVRGEVASLPRQSVLSLRSLLLWWIVPGALFFCFMFLVKGEILLLVPPLILAAAHRLARGSRPPAMRSWAWLAAMLSGVVMYELTPTVPPVGAAVLAPQLRTDAEKRSVLVERALGTLASSKARLRAIDLRTAGALALLDRVVEPGAIVLTDYSTGIVLDSWRTLVYRPGFEMLRFLNDDSVRLGPTLPWKDSVRVEALRDRPLVLLTMRNYARQYLLPRISLPVLDSSAAMIALRVPFGAIEKLRRVELELTEGRR